MVFGSLALFVIFFLAWLPALIFHAAAEVTDILLALAVISIVMHLVVIVFLLCFGRINYQEKERVALLMPSTSNR